MLSHNYLELPPEIVDDILDELKHPQDGKPILIFKFCQWAIRILLRREVHLRWLIQEHGWLSDSTLGARMGREAVAGARLAIQDFNDGELRSYLRALIEVDP